MDSHQLRPGTPGTPAKANGYEEHRPQTPSSTHSSSHAASHKRSITISKGYTVSIVLISSALEIILASKEAKRSTPLRESAHNALDMIRVGQGGDRPREIFEPLRLACETRSEKLMIASLDCISKLISYLFFAEPSSAQALPSPPPSPSMPGRRSIASASHSSLPQPSLVDLVVHTITTCHSDTSTETVSLQVVKALLSLVLSPTIYVHHSSLLKAVRTVYNVFLLSTDLVNQMVAQGGLTQMRPYESAAEMSPHPGVPSPPSSVHDPDVPEGTISPAPPATPEAAENGHAARELSTQDMFIKDAFLVFRALCKLTMKPLNTESERDLKSHAMRSKLLSLHLVLTILNSHMALFVDPKAIIYSSSTNEATTFVQGVNQYLCLSLSRNAVSPVPQVFEVSVEIFWRVLSGMRTKLKTSTLKQKAVILGTLSRLCQDPQALVEIYLNYDCGSEATDNIYEHLMNIISKIATLPYTSSQQKTNDPASPALPPQTKSSASTAHVSSALTVSGTMDTSTMGLSEGQLRRQGLECLVAVLRSLVTWGTAAGKTSAESATADPASRSQTGEEIAADTMTPDPSLDRLIASAASTEALQQSTPDTADDPSRFESAEQKKD
ncbi:guanine nucleotide exchange factor in Golgi transport N-terminal-domain-containing protein [Suillus clintonianus]|uniref:guanine nucleotide exchange factor in Golgi transport N-terminal-domain-containing protein n=1 Tax=Suillus clintonianus TaxID=1904413 RepID=UPI001B87CCEC|nr:guanine nucleotide exchange factor in Golgi transport N-terminal-domain-containing protein [Suillus clintonianus]KAG2109806.1 guanine nucleotide exchange factor in Golgi transport N-terminal-domain-containing protein [Suillus clintonianus]